MTGADILLPLAWPVFLFVVFRLNAKAMPRKPWPALDRRMTVADIVQGWSRL